MSRPPFVRQVAIYQIGTDLLVVPYARTRGGVSRGMALLATISSEESSQVGITVLAMLEKCEDDTPDDYSRSPAPSSALILRETQSKSWSAFHRKSLLVHVEQATADAPLRVTPTQRVGGGSREMEDKERVVDPMPEEIGSAVLSALKDAK